MEGVSSESKAAEEMGGGATAETRKTGEAYGEKRELERGG